MKEAEPSIGSAREADFTPNKDESGSFTVALFRNWIPVLKQVPENPLLHTVNHDLKE